jgi:hypothetical protein
MLRVLRSAILVALVAAIAWSPARAVGGRPAAVPAPDPSPVLADAPIVIDGRFDERTWEHAAAIREFVQREPAEGLAPTHATEARIVFDASALYVAIRAFDAEPERIVGILTRRDQGSPSDWVKVIVDSYFDHRSAYEFAVNPVGVKRDRYYYNDGPSDDSWDAVWDVQVARDDEGWRAEFRIPFSQLRFNSTDGGPVGFALVREVGRLNEISTWPLLSRNAMGFVSQFAEMRGIRLGTSPQRLEVMPYTVGKLSTYPVADGNSLVHSPDPAASVGLDLKYAVTPGLTLTATANPDFGQVEADPAVVNLDAFEVLFPERRPFFVEGSGTFRFNMDCNDGTCTGLFYSRRIGRAPQGSVSVGAAEFTTQPDAATILGAAKLTGRVGQFAVGGLTAVTAAEHAQIAGFGGIDARESLVEPLTAYNVARARREYGNQSSLGFMVTSTARRNNEEVSFLTDHAFTGGVDYDWRPAPRYSISGYWAGSHLRGTTESITRLQQNAVHAFQRPDSDYTELDPTATTLSGHGGSMSVGKIAGDRTRFNTNISYKTPGFDTNDLGFQRRADEIRRLCQQVRAGGLAVRARKPGDAQVPGRRADHQQLVPVPRLRAEPVRPQLEHQRQPVGGLELRRRPPLLGRERQHALDLGEQLQRGDGPEPQRGTVPRPHHAWRPRRARQPEPRPVVLREHGPAPRALVQLQRLPGGRRAGHQPAQRQSLAQPAALVRDLALGGPALRDQRRRCAVGDQRDERLGYALRVRPHRAEDGGDDAPLQLHDDAEPVAADLRGAVRLGGGLHELPGAGGWPRARLRGSLRPL